MGAWGTGAMDNDVALDLVGDMLKYGLWLSISEDKFGKLNEGKIVMAEMLKMLGHRVVLEFEKIELLNTIEEEMTDEYINCWREDCREDRMKELEELKEYVLALETYEELESK